MKRIPITRIILFILFTAFMTPAKASSDTVYLDNGGVIEGVVKSEGKDFLELKVGAGTITLGKKQIARIDNSSEEENDILMERWEKKDVDLEKKREEFLKERDRRLEEYGKWAEEERLARSKKTEAKEIRINRDTGSRSLFVEALLNDKIKTSLVIDTGASIVVLSNKVGRDLGIDLADTKKDTIVLHLAGDRTVEAKMVVLKSVKVQDVEVKDILAAVLLQESKNLGFKDGLLGMTFLSKFNLKMDLKNMKMVLERIDK